MQERYIHYSINRLVVQIPEDENTINFKEFPRFIHKQDYLNKNIEAALKNKGSYFAVTFPDRVNS